MTTQRYDRESVLAAIDTLPDDAFEDLGVFVEYLRFRKNTQLLWLKELVESFKDVQDAVEASEMSEDEINKMISDAIHEVRREAEV